MELLTNNIQSNGMPVECRCTDYAQELLGDDDIKTLVELHLPNTLKRLGGNSGLYQFAYDTPKPIAGVIFVYRGTEDKATACFGTEEETAFQWELWQTVLEEFGQPLLC